MSREPIKTTLRTVRNAYGPARWARVQPREPGALTGREELGRTGPGMTLSGRTAVIVGGDGSIITDNFHQVVILGPAAARGDRFDLWRALADANRVVHPGATLEVSRS